MNLGQVGRGAGAFFKIAPDEILAIHDELDLPPGEMKLKKGGGTGATTASRTCKPSLAPATSGVCASASATRGKDEVVGYVLRKPPLAERQAVEDCASRRVMRCRRADAAR